MEPLEFIHLVEAATRCASFAIQLLEFPVAYRSPFGGAPLGTVSLAVISEDLAKIGMAIDQSVAAFSREGRGVRIKGQPLKIS